jgi:hypothetical protein
MEYELKLQNRNQLLHLADFIDVQLELYAKTIMQQTMDEEGRTIDNIIKRGGFATLELKIPFVTKAVIDKSTDMGEPVYQIIHPTDKQKEYTLRLTSELAKEKITPEVFERIKEKLKEGNYSNTNQESHLKGLLHIKRCQ